MGDITNGSYVVISMSFKFQSMIIFSKVYENPEFKTTYMPSSTYEVNIENAIGMDRQV
jgi:hypothetical protein